MLKIVFLKKNTKIKTLTFFFLIVHLVERCYFVFICKQDYWFCQHFFYNFQFYLNTFYQLLYIRILLKQFKIFEI